MKRCPNCKRFGVEFDPQTKKERCVWKNCLWVNDNNIDLDEFNYGINFKDFLDSVIIKNRIPI